MDPKQNEETKDDISNTILSRSSRLEMLQNSDSSNKKQIIRKEQRKSFDVH